MHVSKRLTQVILVAKHKNYNNMCYTYAIRVVQYEHY